MKNLMEIFCRSWGIISLIIAYCWQLYTLWILVQLHEAVPGKRYNRYVELAQAAFGELKHICTCDNFHCLSIHSCVNLPLFCRGKIGGVACSVSNSLFVGRNRNGFDSIWRGDHEAVFPNSLWSCVYLQSSNHSGVVPGFHFSLHCSLSATQPQFNRRALTHRGCHSHHLLHHGLDPLCKPTKATLHLLWTPLLAILFCFCFFRLECTWDCSLCFQGSQFSPRNSGN